MAAYGMERFMYARIASEPDNAAIVYEAPTRLEYAIAGNININRRDISLSGDNAVRERDNGIDDITCALEATSIQKEDREKMLGMKKIMTSSESTAQVKHYEATDKPAPYIGCTFIRNIMRNGVKLYQAFFIHKIMFGLDSEEARTKSKGDGTFITPKLTGTGLPVSIDTSGDEYSYAFMEFTTRAEAVAWQDSFFPQT